MNVVRKEIKDVLVSKGLFLQGMYEKENIDVLMSDKGKEPYDYSLPISQEEYDEEYYEENKPFNEWIKTQGREINK